MGRTSDARQRLIDSASELMHERGYTAVGVSEICAAAGVQKGSFYHFFPSKVELALSVIEHHAAASAEALEELAAGPAPPLERLAVYLDRLYGSQVELRARCGRVLGCPIGNLGLEMSTQEPALKRRLRRELDRQIEVFETVLGQAAERGEVAVADVGGAARSILAMIEGTVMLAKIHDEVEILRDLRRDVLDLVGAGAAAAA